MKRQVYLLNNKCKDRPKRSTDKWHASGVLLLGFENLFVGSDSSLEFHPKFFIVRQWWSAAARIVGWALLAWISM
jgi:hypothetical protein